MTQIDENEARKLIDDVFGGRDRLAEHVERAQASADAFAAAADAYERDDLHTAKNTLDGYVNGAPSEDHGAFDLCAAGAITIARLFTGLRSCECGNEECTGLDLDVRGQPDPLHYVAVAAINAVSGGDLGRLGDVLNGVYRADGGNGLRALAALFVDMRGDVRKLVEESS